MQGSKLKAPPRTTTPSFGGDERLEFGVTGVSFGVDPKSGKKIDQSERPPSSDHPYPTLVDDLAGTKHAWVPGGKFELPDYPPEPAPLKLRRPLSAATHKPMAAPTQRTVPQVEEILRRWLIENRRLHEDRRLTLVRGLTSALRVPKDTTGVPLSLLDSHRAGASYFSIAESENFRTSKAAVTESTKAFRRPGESNVDFRAMAFSGGGALPELNLTTENPAAALGGDDEETFAAAVAKIRLDPDLNEAERWGLEYRMRVALKRVLKGRGAANELWGIPPPKSLSYKMDLLEARRASESANTKGTATGKTRLALSSAYVTAQQLQASWGRMLAAEQMKGGVPCLLYPLSDAEAAALQEAFGSLLFRAEGLVGQEPGQEPSRTLGQNAIDLARLVDAVLYRKPPGATSAALGRPSTAPQGLPSALRDPDVFETRFGRVTVRPPSTLDVKRAMQQAATRPSVKLQLEHVHGYYGMKNTSNNVWFTGTTGEIAFFAAGVGIVAALDDEAHAAGGGGSPRGPGEAGPGPQSTSSSSVVKNFEDRAAHQRHFREHTDDIQCLAVHPNGNLIATGQLGVEPCAILWDPASHRVQTKLRHDKGNRSVHALAFGGPQGRFLATVCTDNAHSVTVWDWAVGRRLSEGAGYKGHPPQVYGVLWDPHGEHGEPGNRFVTYGVNHLKIWTPEMVSGQGVKWFAKQCQWNGLTPRDVLSAAFLPPGLEDGVEAVCRARARVEGADGWRGQPNRRTNPSLGIIVTGHPRGDLIFWKDEMAIRHVQLYAVNPASFGNSPGAPESAHGVRALAVVNLNSAGTRAAAAALSKSKSAANASGGKERDAFLRRPSQASEGGSTLRSSTLDRVMEEIVGGAGHDARSQSTARTAYSQGSATTAAVDRALHGLVRDADGSPPTSSRRSAAATETSTVAANRVLDGLLGDALSDAGSSRARGPPPPPLWPTEVGDSMDSTVNDLLRHVVSHSPPGSPPPPPPPPPAPRNLRYGTGGGGGMDLGASLPGGMFAVPGARSLGMMGGWTTHAEPPAEAPADEDPWDRDDQWVLMAAGSDGVVRLFALGSDTRLPPRDASEGPVELPVPSWPQIHRQPIRALDFDPVTRTLVVGTYECDLWVYRVPDTYLPYPTPRDAATLGGPSLWRRIVNGQSGDMFGVAPHPTAADVFATSCSDSEVYVYHAGRRTILGRPMAIEGASTCCAFSNPDGALLAVGQADGCVQVFDRHRREIFKYRIPPPKGVRDDLAQMLAEKSLAYQGILEAHTGVTVIQFSPDGSVMAVGSRDNYIRLFSVQKLKAPSWRPSVAPAKPAYVDPLEITVDRTKTAFAASSVSPLDRTAADLCSTLALEGKTAPPHSSHALHLYATCVGNSSSVLSIDFSVDGRVLQTVSQSYELLYWDAASGRQLAEDPRDMVWSTFTAKISFGALGVFTSDCSDGTDINSVDRDPHGDLLLAADDFGRVRLYHYPACNRETSAYAFERGHSSHVSMARFTCDGARVISVGGYDRSIFQWQVLRSGPATRDRFENELEEAFTSGMNWEPSAAGGFLDAQRTQPQEEPQQERPPPEHIQRDPAAMQVLLLAKKDSGKKYKNHRLAQLQREMDLQIEAMSQRDEERRERIGMLAAEKAGIDAALARSGAAGPRILSKQAVGRREAAVKPGKVWGPLDEEGKNYGWVDDLDLLGGGVSDGEDH